MVAMDSLVTFKFVNRPALTFVRKPRSESTVNLNE